MKWLYKIWSKYDGFTPQQLPNRMEGSELDLRWNRYIDEVESGDELWIYFFGPGVRPHGVYATGVVKAAHADEGRVRAHLAHVSLTERLTDAQTTRLVARTVEARGLQVFVLPEALPEGDGSCTVASDASTCANGRCSTCSTWLNKLPRVTPSDFRRPERLHPNITEFIPGYWAVPPRSTYLGSNLLPGVRRTTEIFKRFKAGEGNLAFLLALGIATNIGMYDDTDFDCLVPIPLSPEKEARGELDRPSVLARELSRCTGLPVKHLLRLSGPISKRRMGVPPATFERAYSRLLEASHKSTQWGHILLVDDATTKGSTASCAARGLWLHNPAARISLASAALHAIRDTVARSEAVRSAQVP